ncbi:ABC transporter ATP-binding protein [Pararhodobacter sp.]|uniref:ABC transporter ATP-binding protein n=1 Tax=Pararhodobacter sp. TaxID=2127056 RepID=UPI002FDDF890
MPQHNAPLSFRDVSKRYGGAIALAGLTLEVKAGEFLTLLGPSGSGKTTALNILAGFTQASEGEVFIDNRPVGALPPERRNVGMVFQNFALFPHMSVFDNVAFPLRMRRATRSDMRSRVGAALETVHLSGMADRKPAALSGGQRQRVALARAIVAAPPVLLMDECLSALDLKLREEMRDEIRRIHATLGTTVIFVTHDQSEALSLSDRVALLNEGRLCQIDRPQAIYDRPATRFVADFIGRTNIIPRATLEQISGHGWRAPGAAPWASIRPERLHLSPQPGDIRLSGTIEDLTFLGASIEGRLRLPDGQVLRFAVPRAGDTPCPAPGQETVMGCAPADIVTLND